MNQDQSKAFVFDLVDVVRRSWWTVVAGLCLGLAGALIALSFIPKIYEARARIRVAPPKIPMEFVKSTVTDSLTERLWTMREAVFSESFLDTILDEVYAAPPDSEKREAWARWVRSRISLDPSTDGLLALSFRDKDPKVAADVVNRLCELCIAENTRQRSESAAHLTETLRSQLDEANAQWERKRAELADFVASRSEATFEYLEFNRRSLETAKNDLVANREAQTELEEILVGLNRRKQFAATLDTSRLAEEVTTDPDVLALRKRQDELVQLRVNYHDDHPAVSAKLREIEDLKRRIAERERPPGAGGETPGAARSPLDEQIARTESELERLQRERAKLQREAAKFQGRIDSTADNQNRLEELRQESSRLGEQVTGLERDLQRARSGQELEERQQGSQLEIVEAARVPVRPVEPDPLRVYVVGLVAGLALLVGPLLLRHVLTPVVASESGLRGLGDVPVLVSIPRVLTPDNLGEGRRRLARNFGLSLLASAALVATVAYFGMG